MKLMIGLGNPGKKYENNRHNVGFMVVDAIIRTLAVSPHVEGKLDSLVFYHHASQTVFARPQTFMNSSGVAVKKLLVKFRVNLTNLWVIHDDLDIKLGQYKIQKGVGPKLHYGIQSIEKEIKTKDFWHVRIGVDNRQFDERISGERYVLQDFDKTEIEIRDSVIETVVNELIKRLINNV